MTDGQTDTHTGVNEPRHENAVFRLMHVPFENVLLQYSTPSISGPFLIMTIIRPVNWSVVLKGLLITTFILHRLQNRTKPISTPLDGQHW